MTTYRYKNYRGIIEAVKAFFSFGLLAATITAITAMVILLAMGRISNCGYVGFRVAVLLVPALFSATWALVSGSMLVAFSRMASNEPPPPPLTDKPAKQRKLSFSRGSKKGFVTWEK
jgi:hypothetical protein